MCRNPSFGLVTKARACKVMGQEGSSGVTPHDPGNVGKCEGMNLHIPKGDFILGVGVPLDFRIFRERLCRNPTLAKCGGEAQHLEKVRIWSPLGLPNVQSSTTRPKTPRIGVFLVSLERS